MSRGTCERSKSEDHLKIESIPPVGTDEATTLRQQHLNHQQHQLPPNRLSDEMSPPPIPPLPINYQRSDGENNFE